MTTCPLACHGHRCHLAPFGGCFTISHAHGALVLNAKQLDLRAEPGKLPLLLPSAGWRTAICATCPSRGRTHDWRWASLHCEEVCAGLALADCAQCRCSAAAAADHTCRLCNRHVLFDLHRSWTCLRTTCSSAQPGCPAPAPACVCSTLASMERRRGRTRTLMPWLSRRRFVSWRRGEAGCVWCKLGGGGRVAAGKLLVSCWVY